MAANRQRKARWQHLEQAKFTKRDGRTSAPEMAHSWKKFKRVSSITSSQGQEGVGVYQVHPSYLLGARIVDKYGGV
jgi:hypothetical protein